VLFLASEPLTDKIVWENGNRYTFRLRPSTYMQVAMLVPEAAKLKKKRWRSSTRTTEYGSGAASFRKLLAQAQPGVEFVTEQAPALARWTPGGGAGARRCEAPTRFQRPLRRRPAEFVREGNTRGLSRNTLVVNLSPASRSISTR